MCIRSVGGGVQQREQELYEELGELARFVERAIEAISGGGRGNIAAR
jgi:hypothetical protein